ncbi:MAG: DUF2147 domain-containing protein [Microscillaceae bacterium]|nr:DUF2147 domain-containing protein [Microscillaceae bacterium]
MEHKLKFFMPFLMILILGSSVLTLDGDQILGNYVSPDAKSKMQVYKEGDVYFGKLTYNKENKVKLGTIILKNLVYANKEWKGTAFAPARNKELPVTVTMPDAKTLSMTVKVGLSTQTKTWKKE